MKLTRKKLREMVKQELKELTATGGGTKSLQNIKYLGVEMYYEYLDNLSLMEVGTASGWTDADQQLDIPQTALQSYNQLAWSGGADDAV